MTFLLSYGMSPWAPKLMSALSLWPKASGVGAGMTEPAADSMTRAGELPSGSISSSVVSFGAPSLAISSAYF